MSTRLCPINELPRNYEFLLDERCFESRNYPKRLESFDE